MGSCEKISAAAGCVRHVQKLKQNFLQEMRTGKSMPEHFSICPMSAVKFIGFRENLRPKVWDLYSNADSNWSGGMSCPGNEMRLEKKSLV